MWTGDQRLEADATMILGEVISEDDMDADGLLQLQAHLIHQTQTYLNLVRCPELTDSPALEAICFLAVVENQIGLDHELFESCLTILGISYKQIITTATILEQIYGIISADLLKFVMAFAKSLRKMAEVNVCGN